MAQSIIQTCIDRIYNVQLAWRYAAESPEHFPPDERPEFTYAILDKALLDKYFTQERYYYKSFSRIMDRGYVGAVVLSGDEWASFVWLRTPGSPAPVGLPLSIARDDYWMINSYTALKFRGKGLYKRNMAFMMNEIFRRETHPVIHAITRPDNIAPHKSLRWLGFAENGVMRVYSFWIPRVLRWSFYATWRKDQPHAELIKGPR